jgi:hypothetical protein
MLNSAKRGLPTFSYSAFSYSVALNFTTYVPATVEINGLIFISKVLICVATPNGKADVSQV